jgi:fructokinase
MEMWVSGTAVARDFRDVTRRTLSTPQILAASAAGDADAEACVQRLEGRLARGLAHVINILDPDVIVFGGGLSKAARIYPNVARLLPRYVFGGEDDTPLLPAKFGDSSGVRGAAWLWPQGNSLDPNNMSYQLNR